MSFERALRAAGLLPREVVADGVWHRCPTVDKPKRKNGAYLLEVDGQRGWFRNFATDVDVIAWAEDRRLTDSVKRRPAAEAKAREAEERARRIEAMKAMRAQWQQLAPLRGGHSYIDAKGLTLQGVKGLRVDGDKLVIPMVRNGYLQSLQTITPNGQKKYCAGCPVQGGTFHISRPDATLTCFAEGFATGLAVFQSVPHARVIVCFNAGNLVRVAQEARPRGLTVVCADNDSQGSTNIGVQKGQRAAELMRCGISYPKNIKGTDWADALKEWGSAARVRVEIMRGARFVADP